MVVRRRPATARGVLEEPVHSASLRHIGNRLRDGPRREVTLERRGFYAAERVVTYLKDLDPAFVEWRLATDDASAGEVAGWIAGVRSPALVIAGETRLGSQLDDNGEWALKKAIKDLTVKRFPGTGHVIHGYRPEPFLEALEPFLRRVRAPEGATGP